MRRGGEGDAEKLTEAAGHVEYHDNMKNQHILRIKNVKKNDSAEYIFRLEQDDKGWKPTYLPGVIVTVTGKSFFLTKHVLLPHSFSPAALSRLSSLTSES